MHPPQVEGWLGVIVNFKGWDPNRPQHPRDHGYARTLEMFEQSCARLQTTYIDLYLLHYPSCWGSLCAGSSVVAGTWRDAWSALEHLHRQVTGFDVKITPLASRVP